MNEEGTTVYHIANDQRERKSAAKLSAAAERILLGREPQKLSVSLLSSEAGVSRTTFYRLFDEPDDVLKYMADETFHRILQGYFHHFKMLILIQMLFRYLHAILCKK